MNKKDHIICCGEILFDLIEHSGKGDELSFEAHAGGSSANISIILSKLGNRVSLISRLGTDLLSDLLISRLNRQGISTSTVLRDPSLQAPLAFARIDEKGDSTYQFYETAIPFSNIAPDRFKPSLSRASVFHTGSFFSYSDNAFELVLALLHTARQEQVFVTYDPNWRESKIDDPSVARKRLERIFPQVDLLKLSVEDAAHMTGSDDPDIFLPDLVKKVRKGVVVTMGEKGAVYSDGDKRVFQPCFDVQVEDTIGAGDGFTAGLIDRIAKNGAEEFFSSPERYLECAAAAAALICTSAGATRGISSPSQVDAFLAERS